LPAHSDKGFKLGGPHFAREPIDPDQPDRQPSERQMAAQMDFLRTYLPDVAGKATSAAGCIYTKTPDEDFIIDRVPGLPQVLAVSPCSGHGYKFTPVIGEIIADLATSGRTAHVIGPFSLARFGSAA